MERVHRERERRRQETEKAAQEYEEKLSKEYTRTANDFGRKEQRIDLSKTDLEIPFPAGLPLSPADPSKLTPAEQTMQKSYNVFLRKLDKYCVVVLAGPPGSGKTVFSVAALLYYGEKSVHAQHFRAPAMALNKLLDRETLRVSTYNKPRITIER